MIKATFCIIFSMLLSGFVYFLNSKFQGSSHLLCIGRIVSDLVGNPKVRFTHDAAHKICFIALEGTHLLIIIVIFIIIIILIIIIIIIIVIIKLTVLCFQIRISVYTAPTPPTARFTRVIPTRLAIIAPP